MRTKAVLICSSGIAALSAGLASHLLLYRQPQSLEIRLPKAPGPPIFAGNLTSGGRLVHFVKPEYPVELRHLGYQEVRIRCEVLKDGTVAGITYEGGPAELFPYAKAAVGHWRYEPLRLYSPYTGRTENIGHVNTLLVPFYATSWPLRPQED